MSDEQQLPIRASDLMRPLEFLHKVKYGGAVGKKTVISVVALIVLAIAIIVVSFRSHEVWPLIVIVALVIVVFFGSLFSIDKTLEAHPELALMDGTEILALRKAQMAAKGHRTIPLNTRPIVDPMPPVLEAGEQDES